jgi:hypothetical protein
MGDRDERQQMVAQLTAESESAMAMMVEYDLAPGKRPRKIRKISTKQRRCQSGSTKPVVARSENQDSTTECTMSTPRI